MFFIEPEKFNAHLRVANLRAITCRRICFCGNLEISRFWVISKSQKLGGKELTTVVIVLRLTESKGCQLFREIFYA